MRVELNETEQRLARFVARRRYEANRSSGVPDGRVGPQSAEETDLEGIGAEIAFCRLMNVYPDLDLDHRPDEDLILRTGYRVDVKATRYERGKLLAVTRKAGKAPDLYALMVGTFPVYRCAGVAPAAELLTGENLMDLGHGPTYALPQASLMSVEDWLAEYSAA